MEEQVRAADWQRLRRKESSPRQIQEENSTFTEEEIRTFKPPNGPALPDRDAHSFPITTAHDFKDFLCVTDAQGCPAMVVGGHAVSIWGMYFQEEEPELAKLAPFTSKDMDFVGDRTTALQLAWMVREPAEPAPPGDKTPVLYRIKRLFPDPQRKNSTLEVLSDIPGISKEELRASAVIIESRELGIRVRLLSPIACLKAKTDNLVRLKQEKRQDLRQVRILILCCRAYLRNFIRLTESGQITEGMGLRVFTEFLDWTHGVTAKAASRKYHIDWQEAFPQTPLERTYVPALLEFFRSNFQQTRQP